MRLRAVKGGTGILFLVALCLLAAGLLAGCGPWPEPVPGQTGTLAAAGRLAVQVSPAGAQVWIDARPVGTTPLSLELPPGQHVVSVEMAGYAPLVQAITLTAGAEATVSGALAPLPAAASTEGPISTRTPAVPAPTPTAAGDLPDLVARWMNIQIETGAACDYTSTALGVRIIVANDGRGDAGAFAVDVNRQRQELAGLAAGARADLWFGGFVNDGENVAVVDVAHQVPESDENNNRLAQRLPVPTLPPTCTPPPASPPATTASTRAPRPTPTPVPQPTPAPAAVVVRDSTVTIPTYPFAEFTTQGWNAAFNVAYSVLDRTAYEASGPQPRERIYRTVVLENEVLRLTFLPDLGGRLYEVFYKPTSHRVTYRNPVLKPSPWGPVEQGWWLAVGGIEWCLPVEEHGYEWGVPWQAQVSRDARGATLTLRDTTAADRVRAAVAVRLEAGAGYFTIQPRLENPTGSAVAVKYWTNAMLAPGGRNVPTSRLRFVLPEAVTAVTVHSRGDDWLPDYNQRLPWPVYQGIDFSRLGNWNRWLGFFEDPAAGEFMAVYDEGYDEGMVRIYPADVARGAKVFAFGWADPIGASNWTDDGSVYVEVHGGPAATFDDSVTLPAGGHLQWTETWYPVSGLGGLRYANATAALNMSVEGGRLHVAVAVARPWSGEVVLLLRGREVWRQRVALQPGQALRQAVAPGAAGSGLAVLRLQAADGSTAAEYQTDLAW